MNQIIHRAHHFFDRGIRVVAVAEIQVEIVEAKPLEAGMDRLGDVLA